MAKKNNHILNNLLWKFLERCSGQLISFLVSIILARMLSPEEFGLVAITMIFIVISDSFVVGGFGISLVQTGKYNDDEYSTMFWAGLILSFMLYCILYLLAPFIGDLYGSQLLTDVLRIMALRLPISAINSIQQAFVAQKMIFKKNFLANVSGVAISAAIGVLFAYYNWGVWALVYQNLCMILINTIVLFKIIPWHPRLFFSQKKFKKLFSYGWRMMLTSFLGALFHQLRGLLIGLKYRPSDLAFLNRGERMPQLIAGNVSNSLDSVLFPVFAQIGTDKLKIKETLSFYMCIGSYWVIFLMSILAGISYQFISLILTDKWIEAAPFMVLSCVQETASILSGLNIQSIKAIGRADICLKLEIIKKPIYFIILLGSIQISPLAVVEGNVLYCFIGLIINSIPNKKLICYGIKEQIKDIYGNYLAGLIVFIFVFYIGYTMPPTIYSFLLQIILGIIMFLSLSIVMKLEGYYKSKNYILAKISK